MGRIADTWQTLIHGSPGQRRVMTELRLLKAARVDWELTFIDILDKINKQLGKYSKREERELKKILGAEEPTSVSVPADHKAELRLRARSLTPRIRTRRMPAPIRQNGEPEP